MRKDTGSYETGREAQMRSYGDGMMVVSTQTFIDGRKHLLTVASRYLQWAKQEPARYSFHMAHRKNAQRQLGHLRAATKITILPGTADWVRAMR